MELYLLVADNFEVFHVVQYQIWGSINFNLI